MLGMVLGSILVLGSIQALDNIQALDSMVLDMGRSMGFGCSSSLSAS